MRTVMWLVILLGFASCKDGAAATKARAKRRAPQATVTPQQDPSLILKELVLTHPAAEINKDLFALIDSSQVWLSFQDEVASNGDQSLATVTYVKVQDGRELLTMVIGSSTLRDPALSKRSKQLVIYHEYWHLRGQLDGTEKKEFASTVDIKALKEKLREDPGYGADITAQHFEAEIKAYTKECELAKKLDWVSEMGFCQAYVDGGELVLRKEIGRMLLATNLVMQLYRPFIIKSAGL